MMHLKLSATLLSFLTLLASSNAQSLISSLSFGQTRPIPNRIPGFELSGTAPHRPLILSDRVQLTPPYPGNLRGAISATSSLVAPSWSATLSFRASGPERGAGSLQVWLTSTQNHPGSDLNRGSVYSVDKFDGLAIVVDQHSGSGGKVRGFMNDGTIQYRGSTVDNFAFGHCDFSYRNLGRFVPLSISQSVEGLEVKIDNRVCFRAQNVRIPDRYWWSVVASSAETPDAFEVESFATSEGVAIQAQAAEQVAQQMQGGEMQPPSYRQPTKSQDEQQTRPSDASGGQPGVADMTELLSRLSTLQTAVDKAVEQVQNLEKQQETRHQEITNAQRAAAAGQPAAASVQLARQDQIDAVEKRLSAIEAIARTIQRDVEGRDYKESLVGLTQSLKETREGLTGLVTSSAPRMGTFVFVVVGAQVLLAGTYVVYKARRARSSKKLL